MANYVFISLPFSLLLLLPFPPPPFSPLLQTSYTIFIVITLFLYLAFQDPNFTPRAVFPWFALTMFLFGHALMPWVYCLSLLFRSPTAAFIVIFCVYFFGGFAFLIVDSIVYIIAKEVRENYIHPVGSVKGICVCVCACVYIYVYWDVC